MGMNSSGFDQRFWWPLDLSPRAESAFRRFRSQMLERPVSLDATLVESSSAELARVMSRHVSEISQRDRLAHLSHVLNGWGDVRVAGLRISDRVERFIHRDSHGHPYILQCDPEGEFHPWQTFAYAVMVGVDPDVRLGSGGVTLRDLALNSRYINTKEGRELGHLLFALAELDPEMSGGPFSLQDEVCDLPKLMELAVDAHHYGTFAVCRKFHLTEGLCAVAAKVPGFESYRDDAQRFLEGQLDILTVLGVILEQAAELVTANETAGPDSLIQELRDALVIGPYIENHWYYAGHIIELAAFADSTGYRIAPEHRSTIAFVINHLNRILPLYLPHAQFSECFLHLGHYRRGMTLFAAIEEGRANDQEFSRAELARFTPDIERLRREQDAASDADALAAPPPPAFQLAYEPINMREGFERVVAEYAKVAPRHFEPRGTSDHHRRMGPLWWPRAIHYELLDYGGVVGAEIHLESDAVGPLGNLVRPLVDETSGMFPSMRVQWEPKWSNSRGRLRVLFPPELSPGAVAAGMVTLIEATFPALDAAVRMSRQLSPSISRHGRHIRGASREERNDYRRRRLQPAPLAERRADAEVLPARPHF